jgi:hypothetical protein
VEINNFLCHAAFAMALPLCRLLLNAQAPCSIYDDGSVYCNASYMRQIILRPIDLISGASIMRSLRSGNLLPFGVAPHQSGHREQLAVNFGHYC